MWEVPEKWPACPHHPQIPKWGRATGRGRGEKPSLGQNHFALFPHLLQIEYFCERQLTRASLLMRNVTTTKCSFSICFLFEMLLQIASKCVFPFQVCPSLVAKRIFCWLSRQLSRRKLWNGRSTICTIYIWQSVTVLNQSFLADLLKRTIFNQPVERTIFNQSGKRTIFKQSPWGAFTTWTEERFSPPAPPRLHNETKFEATDFMKRFFWDICLNILRYKKVYLIYIF